MSKYVFVSAEKPSFFSCILLSQFLRIYLRESVPEILGTIQFRISLPSYFRNLKIKIYKTVNTICLYRWKTWPLSPSKEFRFRVFQNKVLKWSRGPKNRTWEEEKESYITRSFIICRFQLIVYQSFIHQWLYSPMLGPGLFFSFVISFTQMVGLLGGVISPSQGSYLHTGQHKHIIKAHTDIHALSGIRTQDPAFERAKTVLALYSATTVIVRCLSLPLLNEGRWDEAIIWRACNRREMRRYT
jgi:hypothetical protein